MKFTTEGKEKYLSRIEEAIICDFLNGWEMSFLEDIHDRIYKSNPATLTDKQWNRLETILEKAGV